ncbi:hypothetical protein CTAYLR_008936 [Chrysophaeum taylorii]|uniref:HhH-GPD domain-containing protein n=1 Tax=Chrysophaeum taylorii TaxID=2483200 RepID=A0AAD7UID6_9STRA|nr:hypothetical protein CTAYLR_008936 [Chrysophaeum taylorii]
MVGPGPPVHALAPRARSPTGSSGPTSLVSEVMLQQTQVDRVVPYYGWLAKWPTVDARRGLHRRGPRPVDGLGYYRRAAFLVELVPSRSSRWTRPKTRDAWLKGVGPYTAAAIASICFDERVPVVDGNVVRVLASAPRRRRGKRKIVVAPRWRDRQLPATVRATPTRP